MVRSAPLALLWKLAAPLALLSKLAAPLALLSKSRARALVSKAGALLALLSMSGCTHLVWYGRSPDRRHVAAVIERGGQQLVRHDARDGFAFAGIGVEGLQLDSKRVVYPAQLEEGGWVVVLGAQQQSERFDAIGAVVLAGGHAAFAAERKGKWFVVSEGARESGPWDEVLAGSLRVSASGTTTAFAARRDGKTFVLVNDEERGPFDAAGQLRFQRERVTFTARTTEGVFVHEPGGGVLGPWEDVVELGTSDQALTFAAREGKAWKVFRKGALSAGFERVAGLTFAGDRVLFGARINGAEFVVDGERTLGPFITLKRQLYVAGDAVVLAGKRENGWWVLRDGRPESGPWEDVSSLVGSGTHDAFIAERDGRSIVVVDGAEQRSWEQATGLALNTEGKPLYFVRSGAQSLVVDGDRTTPFDLVLADTLVFSADGRHFGCVTGERKTKKLFITFDDGARVPLDFEELTAAITRVPQEALLSAPESDLLRRWVEAELKIHFGN